MKRSTAILLLGVGAGAVALYALGDDGKSREAHAFETVQDCVLSGAVGEQRCRQEFDEAMREHERTAPKYQARSECEAEFGAGACQERNVAGIGNVFMPIMAGYLFSQLASGRHVATQPLYRGQCPPNTPDCRPPGASGGGGSGGGGSGVRSTAFRTGSGVSIVLGNNRSTTVPGSGTFRTPSRPSTVAVPRSVADAPPSRPNVVSRNGFGQTSRSVTISTRSSGT